MRIQRYLTYSLAAILMFGVSLAHADVLLESYVERRPGDAERAIVERFKAALAARGVLTKADQIVAHLSPFIPLPGNLNRDITRTQLIVRITRGTSLAAHEAYDDAVTVLTAVFQDLENNPALAASDPESSSWITQGRVALAYSYARSKRPTLAASVIAEHIRSYPDISLKGEQNEVEKLYDAEVLAQAKLPRGHLVFRVTRPEAEIFVNGLLRGKGQIDLSLVPADYQIVVRVGVVYRGYKAKVIANDTTPRVVNWPMDVNFTAGPDWVGLVGPGAAAFAEDLARRGPGDAVIMVGLEHRDERQYLVVNRYEPDTGVHSLERAVDVEKTNDQQMADLAKGAVTPGDGRPAERVDTAPATRTTVPRWPVLVAAGTMAVSVPTGAFFIRENTNCNPKYMMCSPTDLRIGSGLLGVGGVALAFGVFWVIRVETSTTAGPIGFDVQPVRGGGVARLSGHF